MSQCNGQDWGDPKKRHGDSTIRNASEMIMSPDLATQISDWTNTKLTSKHCDFFNNMTTCYSKKKTVSFNKQEVYFLLIIVNPKSGM